MIIMQYSEGQEIPCFVFVKFYLQIKLNKKFMFQLEATDTTDMQATSQYVSLIFVQAPLWTTAYPLPMLCFRQCTELRGSVQAKERLSPSSEIVTDTVTNNFFGEQILNRYQQRHIKSKMVLKGISAQHVIHNFWNFT